MNYCGETKAPKQAAPHLLSFVTHQSQETFFQVRMDEKTNEITNPQVQRSAHWCSVCDEFGTKVVFYEWNRIAFLQTVAEGA